MLQEDYLKLVGRIGSREATTRRFFVIFEYEAFGRHGGDEEADAVSVRSANQANEAAKYDYR